MGADLGVIARKSGDHWIVLHTDDRGYGVREGAAFNWGDTLCCQMVAGNGPRVAPRTTDIPAYANAPINRQIVIGTYIGIPLLDSNDELFGTLCALHPQPLPEQVKAQQSILETLAHSFNTILRAHLSHGTTGEAVAPETSRDTLTGTYNYRAWRQLLAQCEQACQDEGHTASVFAIRLDGEAGAAASDARLQKATRTIRGAIFSRDVLARVDSEAFAVLARQCDPASARIIKARVEASLAAAKVPASVGVAQRDPMLGLKQAWKDAYLAMHRARKQRQSGPTNGDRAASAPWN